MLKIVVAVLLALAMPGDTEPYHLKMLDELGVRLGMSYADYLKTHPTRVGQQECSEEPDHVPGDIGCTVRQLTPIHGLQVREYISAFCLGKLCEVILNLKGDVSTDDTVIGALKEKFGPPMRQYGDGTFWRNEVSALYYFPGPKYQIILDMKAESAARQQRIDAAKRKQANF